MTMGFLGRALFGSPQNEAEEFYRRQAAGGFSAAAAQQQAQQNQSFAQALAQAQMAGAGSTPALAYRNAQEALGQANAQTFQQALAAQMRERERGNMGLMGLRDRDDQRIRQGLGTVFQTAGTLGAFLSDERAKTDVEDGTGEARDFLQALAAHRYRYKDEHGGGERLGPMAQELERSAAGKRMVSEGPDGLKRVDFAQALQATMAGAGDLHRRLSALEERDAG